MVERLSSSSVAVVVAAMLSAGLGLAATRIVSFVQHWVASFSPMLAGGYQ